MPKHPVSGFFFHPGSRGQKSTRSRIRIRNTGKISDQNLCLKKTYFVPRKTEIQAQKEAFSRLKVIRSFQFCGSGIQYLFDPWIRGSVMGEKTLIRDIPYIPGLKIHKFLDADPG
jgi:hypothetical protein